jgi:hypothetical protein
MSEMTVISGTPTSGLEPGPENNHNTPYKLIRQGLKRMDTNIPVVIIMITELRMWHFVVL